MQAKPIDTSKPADVPLSPDEVAEMKEHLKFLRDWRKALNLRLNATEDLLLNGAREPTHRGICQHLFDKVERPRVELVAQRLDPASRSRLFAGLVRFSSDVAYLLSYLESVKDSASQADATAALSQALRRIDFTEISAAQMRRLLELIAELFDERDRPQLLFGLLSSPTFRGAFDRSAEQLPPALSEAFLPLRAAHAVVVAKKPNPLDAAALSAGVRILLSARERVLRAHPPGLRQRLFELGLGLASGASDDVMNGLGVLADAMPDGDHRREHALLDVAGARLAAGQDDAARKLLQRLTRDAPGFRAPARLLEALEGERFGRIAVMPPRDGEKRKGGSHFRPAIDLRTQQRLWLRDGTAEEAPAFESAATLARELVLPSLLRPVESGKSAQGLPYFALPARGRGAFEMLRRDGGLSPIDAAHVAEDAAALLGALAAQGVVLPDVRFDRFAIDGQRLWLRDLLGATRLAPADATVQALPLARELCLAVLGRRMASSPGAEALSSAESFAALCDACADLAARAPRGPRPQPK